MPLPLCAHRAIIWAHMRQVSIYLQVAFVLVRAKISQLCIDQNMNCIHVGLLQLSIICVNRA